MFAKIQKFSEQDKLSLIRKEIKVKKLIFLELPNDFVLYKQYNISSTKMYQNHLELHVIDSSNQERKNLKSLLLTWNDHHQKRSSSLHFLKINGLSVQLSLMMRSVTQSRLIYFKLSRLKLRMIQGKHIGFIVKEKVLMHLKKNMF